MEFANKIRVMEEQIEELKMESKGMFEEKLHL